MIPTRTFLAYTVNVLRAHGWVSAPAAQLRGQVPTYQIALDLMTSAPGDGNLAPDDLALVDQALAWIAANRDPVINDYLHDLAELLSSNTLMPDELDRAASLLVTFQRDNVKKAPEPTKSKEHFGDVGVREVFKLELLRVSTHRNDWGPVYLHVFKDPLERTAVWWASRKALKAGKFYTLKCTVKEHTLYRGKPQTVLTRCTEA